MANFTAVTASNGAKVKDIEAAREALQGFELCMEDGSLGIDGSGRLFLHGYDWLDIVAVPTTFPADLVATYRSQNGRDPETWRDLWDDSGDLEEWQRTNDVPAGLDALAAAIAPHLTQPWVIHCVGNEKCRFPLAGAQWTIHPDGRLVGRGLEG